MTDARETIDRAIAIARGEDAQHRPFQARLLTHDRNTAELGVRRVLAAGYRILGPDEVDPVTLEEAAEVGKEAAKAGDCHHVAAAIRALGRKV